MHKQWIHTHTMDTCRDSHTHTRTHTQSYTHTHTHTYTQGKKWHIPVPCLWWEWAAHHPLFSPPAHPPPCGNIFYLVSPPSVWKSPVWKWNMKLVFWFQSQLHTTKRETVENRFISVVWSRINTRRKMKTVTCKCNSIWVYKLYNLWNNH